MDREVHRNQFKELTNNHVVTEPLVACTECGRKFHQVCVLWSKDLGRPFVCRNCRRAKDVGLFPANRNNLNLWAKVPGLPRSKLSDFLESRVRRVLAPGTPPVTVRVLSVRDKSVEVRSGVREYYAGTPNEMPSNLPFRAKVLSIVWILAYLLGLLRVSKIG